MPHSSGTTSGADRMSPGLGRWLGIFWLLAAPLAATADEQATVEDLLRRMADAVRLLDYQGTFVYLQNDQLEAMHIAHVQTPDGERERLISLNGGPREVVREDGKVTCTSPDRGSVLVDSGEPKSGIPGIPPLEPGNLSKLYGLRLLGRDRVAGREAIVLGIIPRDRFRYGYRLYLDHETSLPLKSDLMDENGTPLEQIMFTRLEVEQASAVPADSTESPVDQDETPATAGEGESGPGAEPDSPRWRFGDLPTGFVVSAHAMHGESGDVEHYVLSDGLASLSVFVESGDAEEGLEGDSRMGAVSASGGRVEGFQVTVVGEVPLLTVRKVMHGLKLAGAVDR